MTPYDKALDAANYLKQQIDTDVPRSAIVLGSGLAGASAALKVTREIEYSAIPHFVRSTVEGHEGRLLIGTCDGTPVLLMKGRVHFYEGYSMEEVTLPVRVFKLLGVRVLILTNAAGGLSTHLKPGDLMLITDHVNLMGDNPLRGPNEARFGPRFPDMTDVYDPILIDIAHEAARESGIQLGEGVYFGLRGPSFETPAEVRMLRGMGADSVGMSTVPEAIVARHSGMRVMAISCITNVAAGLSQNKIDHNEVIEIGRQVETRLAELIRRLIPKICQGTDAGGI